MTYSRVYERWAQGIEGPTEVGPFLIHEFQINRPIEGAPSLSGIIELSHADDDEGTRLVDNWIWYGPFVGGGPLGHGRRIAFEHYATSRSVALAEWIWSQIRRYLDKQEES